jgi:serine/threonine protein kinase
MGAIALDPPLRKELESLVTSPEEAEGFLDVLPIEDLGTLSTESPPVPGRRHDVSAPEPGGRIGPFRILSEIGSGGMGVVYEAEQERPVRRRVALKLIKWGMDTRAVIARFETERQALALMNHPNIAAVYDAGATAQGRPYFAMELVRGGPITEYCDKNQLSIADRLDLFVRICDGVQHAHQKGMIHRDIKPQNILVTVRGNERVP